jgi:hypothetical protein
MRHHAAVAQHVGQGALYDSTACAITVLVSQAVRACLAPAALFVQVGQRTGVCHAFTAPLGCIGQKELSCRTVCASLA